MKKIALVSAVAVAFMSSSVFAQGCGAAHGQPEPLPIGSDSTTAPFDLCTGENYINGFADLGGGHHNDVVYSFVADSANADISVVQGAFPYAVYLVDQCSPEGNAFPLQAITNPPGGDFPTTGLTDGQTYYIVATGSPGENDPVCGTISIKVDGTLPVELQSFSID